MTARITYMCQVRAPAECGSAWYALDDVGPSVINLIGHLRDAHAMGCYAGCRPEGALLLDVYTLTTNGPQICGIVYDLTEPKYEAYPRGTAPTLPRS